MRSQPSRIDKAASDLRGAFARADVVGPAELAGRLSVRVSAVSNWRSRHNDFPRPVATVSGVPMWTWGAIESWAAKTGRLPEVKRGEVTREDTRAAAAMLESARRTVRDEVIAMAAATAGFRADAVRAPRRGERGTGEFDWLETAPTRARRYFVSDVHALTPDVYFDTVADLLPAGATFADAMAAWLESWDLLAAANAMRHGHAPDYVPSGLSFDAGALYGPGALTYLSQVCADEREQLAAYGAHRAEITNPTTEEETF